MGPLFHRPTSARRPLTRAVAALRGPARRPVSGGGRHGAELLPELLGLDGAVQLARAVDAARAASKPPVADATSDGARAEALAHARRRLAEAEREARRPLQGDVAGATLVPAARLERALQRAGAPASRQRRALAAAARDLFTPIEARIGQRISAVRRHVRAIRDDVGPAAAAAGPLAARLEALDAALAAATSARADALVDRAIAAAGDAFAEDLEAAVIGLPRPCDAMPIAAWTGAGGFVGELAARCEGLIVATFLHERARLDMLVASTLGEPL